MLTADYAHAVAYLNRHRFPAYVSFREHDSARGLGGGSDAIPRRIVRTSDGAVVTFRNNGAERDDSSDSDGNNPFRRNWLFRPACYVPLAEVPWRWNGIATTRFTLRETCTAGDGTVAIRHLYADPQTLEPIAADGAIGLNDAAHMTVAFEVRYETVDGYVVPSAVHVHAVGHGWLFWARERADVTYSNYRFYDDAATVRRQASQPASP